MRKAFGDRPREVEAKVEAPREADPDAPPADAGAPPDGAAPTLGAPVEPPADRDGDEGGGGLTRDPAERHPSKIPPPPPPSNREAVDAIGAAVEPRVFTAVLTLEEPAPADPGEKTAGETDAEAPDAAEAPEAPPPPVVGGEGVVLRCRVENRGTHGVVLPSVSGAADALTLSVAGPDGEPVPLTRYGVREIEVAPLFEIFRRSSVTLWPGESMVESYHLSRLFDLSVPGTYTATFARRLGRGGGTETRTARPVRFRVAGQAAGFFAPEIPAEQPAAGSDEPGGPPARPARPAPRSSPDRLPGEH